MEKLLSGTNVAVYFTNASEGDEFLMHSKGVRTGARVTMLFHDLYTSKPGFVIMGPKIGNQIMPQ